MNIDIILHKNVNCLPNHRSFMLFKIYNLHVIFVFKIKIIFVMYHKSLY